MPFAIFKQKKVLKPLLTLCLFFTLYLIYLYNSNAFMFLSNGCEVFIGFTIMIIAINTRNISQNKTFTLLALSLGFVSLVEMVSIFFAYNANIHTSSDKYIYLQVFGDYLKVLSIILFCKFYNKPIKFKAIASWYSAFILIFMLLLICFDVFPSIHEILFFNITIRNTANILLYIVSLLLTHDIYKNRRKFTSHDAKTLLSISVSLNITILLFIFAKPYDKIFNPTAHIALLVYLFFVYKMVIQSILVEPYNMLFNDLVKRTNELEKTKDLYKDLVESLPASILIRQDDKIVFANATSLNLFKCSNKNDIKGKHITSMISPECIVSFIEKSKSDEGSFETQFKTLDENVFDAEVSEIDILFNDSPCTLTLIKDISEKKKINELNLKLQRKIEEDTIRNNFFSNLSHELRTPINVMYSAIQLQDIYISNKNIDGIMKYNEIIKQNCFRLLRMCNNLIDITRLDSNYLNPNKSFLNIVTIIENIILSVSFHVKNKNMSIVFDTNIEECFVLCDGDIIERIMLNLISNSLKYGKDHGNILVNIVDDDDHISIFFEDDGPGIPKDSLDSIFDRFVQVDKSFTRISEGSGLGLPLVKSLVELLDGSISLTSVEGEGCKYKITFPKALNFSYSEVAVFSDKYIESTKTIEKVNIEFSDIYL
ncbi:signal transduction histidine kinase [Gottschalkia acidurici 9a]|uniref:histidine kinase n=1 Tax=Gottschalkia acidurici (strain ATCC 7906 / DSM 604 / BCRC 14475 / CIP 104303 / KCTC 5404 / NCIMB 10678 / 9a) TaxID=1128398 RepID=K0B4Y2_GOTA9|nr:ATP-binding protein [Gottschalkia acidurici]AFS79626.1 signal transduction histidine kinase [Gottschalkia acidurici 9a]